MPPMLIDEPTLATWLYGPIGVGVPEGVEVSTMFAMAHRMIFATDRLH